MRAAVAVATMVAVGRSARAADAPVPAPPTAARWLVYNATLRGVAGNARVDNGFNANCKGWSWQQAGFTDANGGLLPVDATTGNIMNGNVIVGTNIGPGRWVSATTGIGVADLSGGATLQSVYNGMLPFANSQNGSLHISTHGPVSIQNGVGVPGGLIILDSNKTYAGFKEPGSNLVGGTGVPGGKPYLITAAGTNVGNAGGGQFNLELYNCNSGLDPDGAGVQRSVAASAGTGFGQVSLGGNLQQRVLGVVSSNPVVQCTVDVTATNIGNLTQQQFNDAVATYMAKFPNKFNNCTTPWSWLAGFPAEKHLSKLNTLMAQIPVGNGNVQPTWNLRYVQNTALTPGAADAGMDNPVVFTTGQGPATVEYNAPDGGLNASATIQDITGGSADGTTMHLCAESDVDLDTIGTPAPGLSLATLMVSLSPYADSFSSILGSATLEYSGAVDPATLALYELVGSTWVPFSTPGTTTINSADLTATADFAFTGNFDEADGIVLAGFAVAVPEPTTALFGVVAFAWLGRRTRVRR